ncbi:MAG: hypothetical protein IPP90_03850 [Gemmatimonadaceae bacterium]|nr:hypothetical protein [Gemmatimonadaceae bacterium]
MAARWGDLATREPATDPLIATGPVFSALAMARWMRSDSVAIAVLDRASRDRGQVEARFAWGIYAFRGPRLRADPRLQPAFRALGYLEPVRRQTPGRCVAILFSDSPAAPRI